MSDLVERLRGNGQPFSFAEIIAEIERLTKALATSNANCDRMASLAIDNAKDTERLMKAIEAAMVDLTNSERLQAHRKLRAALAQRQQEPPAEDMAVLFNNIDQLYVDSPLDRRRPVAAEPNAELEALARRIARDCTDEYGEIYPEQLAGHLKTVFKIASREASFGGWLLGILTGASAVGILWMLSK